MCMFMFSGGNTELPINLLCMQEGKCKNGSKWPTNNHVSGLTLSRQCAHTFRCTEKKQHSSVSGSVHLLLNTATTQRRVLLEERRK